MALKNLRGRVALMLTEDDFDVDQVCGIANLKVQDAAQLAAFAVKWCGPEFEARVQPGDLIVGGRNFGYGHPHYPCMIAMRHLGISGVIGDSFAPGYWLGEISRGFPQVSCPGILEAVNLWDDVEVDWQRGLVINHTQGKTLEFEPLSESDLQTLEAGGLVKNLKRHGATT